MIAEKGERNVQISSKRIAAMFGGLGWFVVLAAFLLSTVFAAAHEYGAAGPDGPAGFERVVVDANANANDIRPDAVDQANLACASGLLCHAPLFLPTLASMNERAESFVILRPDPGSTPAEPAADVTTPPPLTARA